MKLVMEIQHSLMVNKINSFFSENIYYAGPDPPSELNLRPVFTRVPPPLYSCDDEVKVVKREIPTMDLMCTAGAFSMYIDTSYYSCIHTVLLGCHS